MAEFLPSDLPRSIRNNNPLNIDSNPRNKWVGLMPRDRMTSYQLAEKRFAVFESQVFGFRAAALLLQTYQDRHGLCSIRELINRWAPPSGVDHSTGKPYSQQTDAYVDAVAEAVGRDADDLNIRVDEYDVIRPMIEAMAVHETGRDPRTGKPWKFDPAVIDEGLRRAGVRKPSSALTIESVTPPAAAATVIGADTTRLAVEASQAIQGAEEHIASGDVVRIVLGVALVAVSLWVAYDRYKDAKVRNS